LVVSPKADADLIAIGIYIAERDGLARASAVIERIQETMFNIALMPGIGSSRPYLRPGWRAFSRAPWTIVYIPLRDGIRVLRVLDGRRDLAAIFKKIP